MSDAIEKKIIRILEKANRPLSVDTLHILANVSRRDLYDKLNSLSRYKRLRKVTSRKVGFWGRA